MKTLKNNNKEIEAVMDQTEIIKLKNPVTKKCHWSFQY